MVQKRKRSWVWLGVGKGCSDQAVNFCGQDEVVFAEAGDGVGGQYDGQDAVASEMEVRVMLLLFRQLSNSIESVDRLQEIPKTETAANRLSRLVEFPVAQVSELLACQLGGAGREPSFAGSAFSLDKFICRGNLRHFASIPFRPRGFCRLKCLMSGKPPED